MATVSLSIACLMVFPFIKDTLGFWNFISRAIEWSIFIAIFSLPCIAPLAMFARFWKRKLKSRSNNPDIRERWLILGGTTGIVFPGVYWWWIVFWEFWDYWFLNKEYPDPAGMGQALGIGPIVVMPPLIVLGVTIGLVIGRITGMFAEKIQNKAAPVVLFSSLVVLTVVTTSIMLIRYFY